jgi:hypothetical protein
MAQLPLHLQKLETVPSALDIIRFMNAQPKATADYDTVINGLDISERRFGRATRRLVTTGYMQMRSDYVYQLTERGRKAAEELSAFDADASGSTTQDFGRIRRRLVLALPQMLVAQQANTLQLGLPADPEKRFSLPADIVLRVSGVHADVTEPDNEIVQMGNDIMQQSLTVTPEAYTQARIRVEVFQLSQGGDDLHVCGGMYVDVDVVADGDGGGLVAYGTDLLFEPTG